MWEMWACFCWAQNYWEYSGETILRVNEYHLRVKVFALLGVGVLCAALTVVMAAAGAGQWRVLGPLAATQLLSLFYLAVLNFDIDTETNKINTSIICQGYFPNRHLSVIIDIESRLLALKTWCWNLSKYLWPSIPIEVSQRIFINI